MSESERSFWVFSNNSSASRRGTAWDMGAILETGKYCLKKREKNCSKVRSRDIGYMRLYGEGYFGKFEAATPWELDPQVTKEHHVDAGFIGMDNVVIWHRPVPQSLIIRDLSNQDVRSRLIGITQEDATKIQTAQRVYERLGFGAADGEIVLLERGLEEAIKPNLKKMGLRLAAKEIRQQFSMGPGVGRSDLICTNEEDDLVVIELKRGRSSNKVIGQVSTYVGYVRENIAAEGQGVHGWIITGDYDEGLRLAALAAGVRILVVRLP